MICQKCTKDSGEKKWKLAKQSKFKREWHYRRLKMKPISRSTVIIHAKKAPLAKSQVGALLL